MVTARQVGRWVRYGLGGCLAVVVLARVSLGIYLATPAGKAMVARTIGQRIGLPVEVTAVRVGLVTSGIGLRVFDPVAADPAKAEVFAVEEVDADISLFGLAAGRVAPTWVNLRGVNLTLHVAADGRVLTTLPKMAATGGGGPVPTFRMTGGRVTVRQDGRPEFALRGLDLVVEPAGDKINLSGAIDDPEWSRWTVSGEIDTGPKTGWVRLATADGPLTMDRLGSVPFVPPSVWEHVRADGRGAVSLRVWTGSAGSVEYSVDIRPAAASLTLRDASLNLSNVTGLIRVAGAKVTLAGTRGDVAGGHITADGDLDFGTEPTTVALKVSGDHLDTDALPPEWRLPNFRGKLNGKANLTLRIHADGRIEPGGGGEGTITDVKVLDFPADDIPIHLRKRGDRYEFRQPETEATPNARSRRSAPVQYISFRMPQPADPPNDEKKEPPKKDEPLSLDATVRLRDIEVSELLEKLEIKLAYRVSGKITVEVAVAVPVARAASAAAYEFSGKVSSPALKLEGLTVRDVSAKIVYRNGKATLTDLGGQIDQPGKGGAPGTFRGTATAAVSPPGEATAALTFDRIPLGELAKAAPGLDLDIRGTVSGRADLKTEYGKLWDMAAWSGSGELTSAVLTVEGRTAKGVRVAGEVAKGVFTIKEARATLEGIPVAGEATLGLADEYPFTAVVRTTGSDITDLRRLVPEVEIPAKIEGVLETTTRVTGTASPFTLAATGTVKASKLTLGRSSANHVEATWELTRDRLTVSELKADAFGGTVTGSADVPFDRSRVGKFEIAFKELDVAAASELVPDFPVRIAGKVSGRVGGTIPAAKPGEQRTGTIDLDLTAPRLTVQGIPAERLVGKATLAGMTLSYELEGKTLGGSFEIKGRYPGRKKDKAPADGGAGVRDRGSFRLTNLDLARVAPAVGFRSLAPLRGRVNAHVDFDNDLSAGSGRVTVTGLAWGGTSLARELIGVLVLRDGTLELTEVTGRVAGGELRARARVQLADTSRNFFSVALAGAEAKRLLAPLGAAGEVVNGPVSLVVRGRVGREARASGTLTLPRGSVSGVEVTDLRVPFEAAAAPGGYGRVTVREATGRAGSGLVRAELVVDWGTEVRVEGHARFLDVPLRVVSPELGENALFGNGRITGRFDLGGRNVRSADDLTGTLVATLNNTSVREIPVLRQVGPFMNPSGLLKPFQAGDIRANLANGVFRVQRLALANPTAQLFAEGTISTAGRVDIDVVAHTGTIGPDARGLRLLGLRVPAFGPVPLTLIRDVTDFLSNRTVRLSITGTTGNPVVRVNVGALLRDEAVRFFLSRYVVPADAAAVLGLGSGFDSMPHRK